VKVTLRVGISGTRDDAPWPPAGTVVDLPTHVAAKLLRSGQADPVVDTDDVEKATAPVSETRTRSRSARKS
jgi:hypothetical protein